VKTKTEGGAGLDRSCPDKSLGKVICDLPALQLIQEHCFHSESVKRFILVMHFADKKLFVWFLTASVCNVIHRRIAAAFFNDFLAQFLLASLS
jgi:hypothetical protein